MSARAERPAGVVLAGGAGRRLGTAKGALAVGGVPLALRAARALEPLCDRVLISVRAGAPSPVAGYSTVDDRVDGAGPLAGIDAAFARSRSDLLVLACDYPMVETALLEALLAAASDGAGVVLPRHAGRDHPLVALWRWRIAPAVREALGSGRLAVRDLLERVAVQRIGAGQLAVFDLERCLLNVNHPGDLARLQSAPGSG